jgi:hypothetical protein
MNRYVMAAIGLCASLATCAFCGGQVRRSHTQNQSDIKSAEVVATSEGERRFRTNCGRCHNPPEDLSPREVRAVVRQMRVRAILSAEDEKTILEYLAP